jgi:hypothetical protein
MYMLFSISGRALGHVKRINMEQICSSRTIFRIFLREKAQGIQLKKSQDGQSSHALHSVSVSLCR